MRYLIQIATVLVGVLIITILLFNTQLLQLDEDIDANEMPQIDTKQEMKEPKMTFDDSVFSLMKKTASEIKEILGEPIRIDLTPYTYKWWIYENDDVYLQIGVLNDRVETIFATGKNVDSSPIKIGESYETLKKQFPLKNKVTYQKGISSYTFILSDDELKTHPLIKLENDLFVQCYIDTFTNKVSSLRIITGDLLTLQRFYEMEYRGVLPEQTELTDEEWREVEKSMEKQIFALTNVYRDIHGVPLVKWDEATSEVAYLHSKDMHEKQYFSHESLDGRGLKERLESKNIHYLAAGENIAALHSDAPAVMEGWLNSEGHRETLLNEQYNYLGVGVHRLYYTQNFLLKHE